MRAFIDTSILGAYYCPESGSRAAEEALRRVETPVISTLSEVELHSLVSKKRRLGELSARHARTVLELFESHIAEGYYERLTLAANHYRRARELLGAYKIALHTLDALHLAVAITERLPLITSDRTLEAAARRHKARVALIG